MRITHALAERIGEIYSLGRNYVESQIQLQSLRFKARFVSVVSNFATAFVIFSLVGITVLFASIGMAFLLAAQFESQALGFISISGFYALLALLVYWFRKPLILRPILNLVVQTLGDDDDDDDEGGDEAREEAKNPAGASPHDLS